MNYPTLGETTYLTNPQRTVFEDVLAQQQGYLSVEHTPTGTHGAITSTSVTSDGDGTFGGTVTADSDGNPVSIGPQAAFSGQVNRATNGLDMRTGSVSRWRIGTYESGSNERELLFQDLIANLGPYVLRLFWDASASQHALEPDTTDAVRLGTNASGKRLAEVNTLIARSFVQVVNGLLAPPALTGATHNYNPTGLATAGVLKLDLDAAHDLTGIMAPDLEGTELLLFNGSSFVLTLKQEDGNSSAANRLVFAGGADKAILSGGLIQLIYLGTGINGRWRAKGVY